MRLDTAMVNVREEKKKIEKRKQIDSNNNNNNNNVIGVGNGFEIEEVCFWESEIIFFLMGKCRRLSSYIGCR
jgi:hypothetical protein